MNRPSRPSVVVLFPDDWAAFSPTLTGLVTLLERDFGVEALVLDTGRFDLDSLDPITYRKLSISPRVSKVLRRTRTLRLARTLLLAIKARRAARRATHVIAVDADGALAAFLLGRKFHYLSLELSRFSLASFLVPWRARSITIQSSERLHYHFAPTAITHLPVFLIQNAPNAPPLDSRTTGKIARDLSRPRLVYMGSAIPAHGLISMLELLRGWPEASLTIQGIVPDESIELIHRDYADLLPDGRVRIAQGYLPEGEIPGFLSGFDVGMCLYDLRGRASKDFNYISCPSGKMFNYFAAGLPVVASNLIGLNPVTRNQSGIQSDSNSVDDLRRAISDICADYPQYCENARRAALTYDFGRNAGALLSFLQSESPP